MDTARELRQRKKPKSIVGGKRSDFHPFHEVAIRVALCTEKYTSRGEKVCGMGRGTKEKEIFTEKFLPLPIKHNLCKSLLSRND